MGLTEDWKWSKSELVNLKKKINLSQKINKNYITQEQRKKKRLKKNEQNLKNSWDVMKQSNIWNWNSTRRGKREKNKKNYLKK